MSRKDFHGRRAYAADATEPPEAGFLFGIAMTVAWIKLQLAGLFRKRLS